MENASKIIATDFANYEDVMKSSILFAGLPTDLCSEFLSMSRIVEYPKNSVVYNNEDKADWFYLIIDGWVKMYTETMEGDEAVIDIYGQGEVFGESAIFENFIYSANMQAVTQLKVMKLPIGVLAEKVEHNAQLAVNLSKCLNIKNSAKNKDIEHREAMSASQKIGCFLLRMCDLQAKSYTVNLPFDKILISSKLGMKPETFSRALAKLKETTNIESDGKDFYIPSVRGLSEFCCNACSSHFPCDS